ncbi:MAG: hypothetical protein HRF49_02140 [bacterium]
MQNTIRLAWLFGFALLALLTAPACKSGKSPMHPNSTGGSESNPGLAADAGGRTVLSLVTPASSDYKTGDEFDAVLSVRNCEPVFQGSTRIVFDSRKYRPIKASRGAGLPDETLSVAGLNLEGAVPFSFTALPGGAQIRPGESELLRVRFRVISNENPSRRFGFMSDPAFMQLRDSSGRRISFDTETREAQS